jgi:AraC-like DNA-binding protein
MAQTIIYILFSLPALTIVISAILLAIRGKGAPRIRYSIINMMIVVALSMLFYAQYFNPYLAARYSWGFDFLYCLITPFCAPAYYLFVNCLTDIRRRPVVNVLVFLPTVIYTVLLISAQLLMDSSERHAYICNEILGQNIQMEASVTYNWMLMIGKKLFSVFMPAQGILVMIYGEFRLNTYLSMLENDNSVYQSEKKIKIRGIHALTILTILTRLIMSSLPVFESTEHITLVAIAVAGQIVLVILMVHNVLQLDLSAEDIHGITDNSDYQEETSPLRPVAAPVHQPVRNQPMPVNQVSVEPAEPSPSTLMERIDYVMMNENLFLQPDLSLTVLCEKVGTNRTYASKAIKDTIGCNFPDYVNRFRLDYAIDLMKQTPKEKIIIQNIAMQCGCGSIQSFYRYFKLFLNDSPTQ